MYNKNSISLIQLSNYVKPEIQENHIDKWVLNGRRNSFFKYIIDRYNGSPTNKIIIDTFTQLYYGKGISLNGSNEVYEELVEIFPKREQKKCLADLKMFGQYDMQVIRAKGGGVAKIMHIPTNKLAPAKANNKGEIETIYYCENWDDVYKYKPIPYPSFKIVNGKVNEALSIKSVRPYSAGKFYFSDPDYLAALQYAETEEEISNFFINHIKNGLSFGYIVNLNNGGDLTDEEKQQIENKIKNHLAGTSNAGKFIISFNDSKDAEVTIVPLEVNDAHNQWQFLVDEARQQLITAHGAHPNLFGIATANGLANNADELDVQSKLVQDYQINPKQELFIDELATILELAGLETDLVFIPLRDTYKSTEETTEDEVEPVDETVDEEENEETVELSENFNVDSLIELGETVSQEEWELVDYRDCHEMTLNETQLNTVFEFASSPKTSKKNSEQDTSLFKIRYEYAGKDTGDREFCKKVLSAGKVYREEDLNFKSVYNEDFAPKGKSSYNVFLYKGGVNCKHWWKRVIFLKKGNNKISVNEAKKLILKLDPSDRKDAKWDENPKEVAQSASPLNNWWSLDPTYRK
jgi:hypothetical protein